MNTDLLIPVFLIAFVLAQFTDALLKPAISIVNAAWLATPGARWTTVKPDVIRMWPLYFTCLVAGSLAWFAHLNAFPAFDAPLGHILTAIAIGLGPSFIHDLKPAEAK